MVRVGVDAQRVIQRGEHFLEVDGPLLGFAADAVRGADHLAGPHSAAGQQGAADVRPVVPSAAWD